MAFRFDSYRLLSEPTPSVEKVLEALSSAYVGVSTTFEVFDALAQRGEEFVVMCYGDFTCEVSSQDCLVGEVSEEINQWLDELLA